MVEESSLLQFLFSLRVRREAGGSEIWKEFRDLNIIERGEFLQPPAKWMIGLMASGLQGSEGQTLVMLPYRFGTLHSSHHLLSSHTHEGPMENQAHSEPPGKQ